MHESSAFLRASIDAKTDESDQSNELDWCDDLIEFLYNKFTVSNKGTRSTFDGEKYQLAFKVTDYIFTPRSTKELDGTFKLILRTGIALELAKEPGTTFGGAWYESKRMTAIKRQDRRSFTYLNLRDHDRCMSRLQMMLSPKCRCTDNHAIDCYQLDRIKLTNVGKPIEKLTVINVSGQNRIRQGLKPLDSHLPFKPWVTVTRNGSVTVMDLLKCIYQAKSHKFDHVFEQYSTCESATSEGHMMINLLFNHGV